MWQAALALIPGFVLTVVIGGAYATYLQQRSWQHQNQTRLDEEERNQARELCTALSELLDKRQYRTVRLLGAIENRARGEGSDDELRDRFSEHEQALTEWNDQLTTRLVSVEVYFGPGMRDRLKDGIERRFQEADDGIEKLYRRLMATPDGAANIDTEDVAAMAKLLDAVRKQAHDLGLTMMLLIRRGEIGRAAPQQLPPLSRSQVSAGAQSGGRPAATTATAPKPTSTASGDDLSAFTEHTIYLTEAEAETGAVKSFKVSGHRITADIPPTQDGHVVRLSTPMGELSVRLRVMPAGVKLSRVR